MGIVITVMSGVEDGKIIELSKTPFMLGRHPDDDVCLPFDTKVSRHHATMIQEGNSYFIEDVGPEGKGSTNGTYVGNKKITSKTHLPSGDTVLLGGVWVRFETKQD